MNITKAIMRKFITAVINAPYRISASPNLIEKLLKSVFAKHPISGEIISLTSDVIID